MAQTDRETLFTNEAFVVGMLQAVSGGAVVAAIAQSESLVKLAGRTSFLLFVMVVSILVFSLLPTKLPFYIMIFPRLAMVPLIAGISYEAIRWSARRTNALARFLIKPGLWLQRLTTREPDDEQIAVAIRAL